MKILLNNSDLNEALRDVSNLGFVPTMGSLHSGHISLIKKSLKECEKTIVSIFVNPTQFNNRNDYKRYPRNNKNDLSILQKLNVNFVYLPKKNSVYYYKRKSPIKINIKDHILCAKFRKGHFEGVLDVMDRLIKIIKPRKIYMGDKDFQQLYLIKKYIKKKYSSKVISCKTIRDKNKLALSSRNLLLNKAELLKAGTIAQDLILFKKKLINNKDLKKSLLNKKKELISLYNIKIDYLELRNISNLKNSVNLRNSKLFFAYYMSGIRLIDNY
tara:strand:- start:895 stop:1707 length:813 start_codon:yes stop_codon:yes gene_type:complete